MKFRALAALASLATAASVAFLHLTSLPANLSCDPTGTYSFVSYQGSNFQTLSDAFWMEIEKDRFSSINLEMHNDSEDVQGKLTETGNEIIANGELPWGRSLNPVGTLHGERGEPCDYVDWNDGVRWHRNRP